MKNMLADWTYQYKWGEAGGGKFCPFPWDLLPHHDPCFFPFPPSSPCIFPPTYHPFPSSLQCSLPPPPSSIVTSLLSIHFNPCLVRTLSVFVVQKEMYGGCFIVRVDKPIQSFFSNFNVFRIFVYVKYFWLCRKKEKKGVAFSHFLPKK